MPSVATAETHVLSACLTGNLAPTAALWTSEYLITVCGWTPFQLSIRTYIHVLKHVQEDLVLFLRNKRLHIGLGELLYAPTLHARYFDAFTALDIISQVMLDADLAKAMLASERVHVINRMITVAHSTSLEVFFRDRWLSFHCLCQGSRQH